MITFYRGSQKYNCLGKTIRLFNASADQNEDMNIQDDNIGDLPFKVFKEITYELNQDGLWEDLLATVDHHSVFYLNEYERNDCKHKRLESFGSAGYLLTKWGNKGMEVSDLVKHMDQLGVKEELRMERCLKLIKPTEKLMIIEEPEVFIKCCVGEPIQLECEATGFPYPRYTWFRSTPDEESHEFPTRFHGKLNIPSPGCSDAGSYICRIHQDSKKSQVVWSNSGQWSKIEVKLIPGYIRDTAHIPASPPDNAVMSPLFTLQPKPNVYVEFNGSFVLQCQANGNPSPNFSWLKNDTVICEQTHHDLWVNNAILSDGGTYQCVARNKYGECRSHKVQVYVKAGSDVPIVTSHPMPQKHGLGGIATFRVEAQGAPPLHYKWYHNGKLIPGTSATLTFEVVDRSQTGAYQCQVSSFLPDGRLCGDCMSREARLEVDNRSKLSYTAVDKVALLIAISSTRVSNTKDLPGALNDLSEMVRKLEELDFKTISMLDLNLNEMLAVVDFFYELLAPGVYGVVYLCGHGFIYCGRNYIVPWDGHYEPRPDDCFCVEDAVDRLQQKKPAVFCMILDICRTEQKDVPAQENMLNNLPRVYGNEIYFFATSQDEKSYEEKPSNLPSKSKPRGLFNQYLTQSIKKNIPIIDLFKDVADLFKVCPYPMENTPQHPQVIAQISEHERSLCDPINFGSDAVEMDLRIKRWQNVHKLPPPLKIPLTIADSMLNLNISCERVFSNTMRVHIDMTLPQPAKITAMKYMIKIEENSIPPAMKPIELVSSGSGKFDFNFNNLQRLQGQLEVLMHCTVYVNQLQHPVVKMVPFGQPLISQEADLFRRQYRLGCTPRPKPPGEHRREPTEHGT